MTDVCSNAKAAGTTIYAVFVDLNGTQGNSTVLQNCATDRQVFRSDGGEPDHFDLQSDRTADHQSARVAVIRWLRTIGMLELLLAAGRGFGQQILMLLDLVHRGIIRFLAVAKRGRSLAVSRGASIGDARGAPLQRHGRAAGGGRYHHRAIADFGARCIERDNVGGAECLAEHEGVALVDYGDVGDHRISDIEGGNRFGENHQAHLIQRHRDCGVARMDDTMRMDDAVRLGGAGHQKGRSRA